MSPQGIREGRRQGRRQGRGDQLISSRLVSQTIDQSNSIIIYVRPDSFGFFTVNLPSSVSTNIVGEGYEFVDKTYSARLPIYEGSICGRNLSYGARRDRLEVLLPIIRRISGVRRNVRVLFLSDENSYPATNNLSTTIPLWPPFPILNNASGGSEAKFNDIIFFYNGLVVNRNSSAIDGKDWQTLGKLNSENVYVEYYRSVTNSSSSFFSRGPLEAGSGQANKLYWSTTAYTGTVSAIAYVINFTRNRDIKMQFQMVDSREVVLARVEYDPAVFCDRNTYVQHYTLRANNISLIVNRNLYLQAKTAAGSGNVAQDYYRINVFWQIYRF